MRVTGLCVYTPTPPYAHAFLARRCLLFLLAVCCLPSLCAGEATGRERGFIQAPDGKRYFQWEDGTPFFPIGQNDWPPAFDQRKRTPAEMEKYFANLKEHGVNVLRLMADVGNEQDALWVETSPGTFNPEFTKWMDTIVELSQKHDVYLIVAFYPNIIGGPFGNWRFYPYSNKKGGDLEEHYQMVSDPRAFAHEEARMRYFVDHWGASPNILSWELFNEFWLPNKERTNKECLDDHNRWIDRMGEYIKTYEMKKLGRSHLRSVSCMRSEFPEDVRGLKADDTNLFRTKNLDFASYHGYGRQLRGAQGVATNFGILMGQRIEPERLLRTIHQTVGIMLQRAPDRPVFCTEDFQFTNPRAKSYRNPVNPIRKMFRDYTDEERRDLFLAANWAFIMSGAAGPTMRYPEEFFEDELYDTHRVLRDFAARVPWGRFQPQPAVDAIAPDRKDLIAMALSDGRHAIAWFYHNVPFKERKPIQFKVDFRGIRNAASKVSWIDGWSGRVLREDDVSRASPFALETPAFQGHVACIVEPKRGK